MPKRPAASPAPPAARASRVQTKKHVSLPAGSGALVSSREPAAHLIQVGARVSGRKLIDLFHALRPKLDAHPRFASFGFDAAWADAVESLCAEIEASTEHKSSLHDDALPTAGALHDAIDAAKEWRRDAAAILSVAPKLASKVPALHTGTSVDALAASIRKLLPLVSASSAAPFGGGAAMKASGTAALAALTNAQAAHKKASGAISPAVRETSRLEGILYEELRRLARIARRVCPTERALFVVTKHVRVKHPSLTHAGPAAPAKTA